MTEPGRSWQQTDILIVCNSFERRCLGLLRSSRIEHARRALVLNMMTRTSPEGDYERQINAKVLFRDVTRLSRGDSRFCAISPYDPDEVWALVRAETSRLDTATATLTIDITCLTKILTFTLVRRILSELPQVVLRLAYTEPQEYISSRSRSRRTPSEYRQPSFFPLSRPRHAPRGPLRRSCVALLGNEGDRTLNCWNHVDPDVTYLLRVKGEDGKAVQHRTSSQNEYLLRRAERGETGFHCEDLPRGAFQETTVQVKRVIDRARTVVSGVAPQLAFVSYGPKLTTAAIAVAAAGELWEWADFVYAAPKWYDPRYCSGVKRTVIVELRRGEGLSPEVRQIDYELGDTLQFDGSRPGILA